MIQIAQWFWRTMGDTSFENFYTLLVFIGGFLMVTFIQWLKYNRSLPPGPWGLPIWGSLLFVKYPMHLYFKKLVEKYGPIFSISFGSKLTVVLSDYHIIRDSFRREIFAGRPDTDFMNIIDGYGKCQQIPIIRFISRL